MAKIRLFLASFLVLGALSAANKPDKDTETVTTKQLFSGPCEQLLDKFVEKARAKMDKKTGLAQGSGMHQDPTSQPDGHAYHQELSMNLHVLSQRIWSGFQRRYPIQQAVCEEIDRAFKKDNSAIEDSAKLKRFISVLQRAQTPDGPKLAAALGKLKGYTLQIEKTLHLVAIEHAKTLLSRIAIEITANPPTLSLGPPNLGLDPELPQANGAAPAPALPNPNTSKKEDTGGKTSVSNYFVELNFVDKLIDESFDRNFQQGVSVYTSGILLKTELSQSFVFFKEHVYSAYQILYTSGLHAKDNEKNTILKQIAALKVAIENGKQILSLEQTLLHGGILNAPSNSNEELFARLNLGVEDVIRAGTLFKPKLVTMGSALAGPEPESGHQTKFFHALRVFQESLAKIGPLARAASRLEEQALTTDETNEIVDIEVGPVVVSIVQTACALLNNSDQITKKAVAFYEEEEKKYAGTRLFKAKQAIARKSSSQTRLEKMYLRRVIDHIKMQRSCIEVHTMPRGDEQLFFPGSEDMYLYAKDNTMLKIWAANALKRHVAEALYKKSQLSIKKLQQSPKPDLRFSETETSSVAF
ncbi:hypothetical protein NEDG_01968 [Nematocida displodere]|uniref:Uncharacterized protein n=1 Tax=Nematocida displodere TaxID=1805483 RepID=A0A177EIY8_9MICR|nr:hypothetical protein NEDG_01968 [Nematocida displodere]